MKGYSKKSTCRNYIIGFFYLSLVSLPTLALDEALSSVVTIFTHSKAQGSGQANGFVVGERGLIATNYHVVAGSTGVEVFGMNGEQSQEVKLVAKDIKHDLALLRVEGFGAIPPIPNANRPITDGSELRLIGAFRGLPSQILSAKPTSPHGYVSSFQIRSQTGDKIFSNDINIIPLDATIYSGMSGSPVVNTKGEVIGILSGSYSEGGGIAWAIPAEYLTALQANVLEEERIEEIKFWPELTLMTRTWRSLKRSYDKPYTVSQHYVL